MRGLDLSSSGSYGTKVPTTVGYDVAPNFPTVSILTFFRQDRRGKSFDMEESACRGYMLEVWA